MIDREDIQELLEVRDQEPTYFTRTHLTRYIEKKIAELDAAEKAGKVPAKRTPAQNNSIHLWLSQVADELNNQGQTLQNVVAEIKRAEVRPTMENLKEAVWRPYQIAATGKESSTQLEKPEVDKVYEGLNKFFGEHFGIHIPFPSQTNEAFTRAPYSEEEYKGQPNFDV
jgi:hypothetical protein